MMRNEDPHQTAPEDTAPAIDQVWDHKAKGDPEKERPIHEERDFIVHQVLGVTFRHATGVTHHPADMGVEEALEGTVGITGFVGQTVMLPVGRDPGEYLAFDRHRSQGQYHELDHRSALKAAMRGEAMKADGDAESGE